MRWVEWRTCQFVLDCPPIFKTVRMGSRFLSLIYGEEQEPATPNLGAEHGSGKECWQTPLVKSNRTRNPTLREIRWPEAILQTPVRPRERSPSSKPGIFDTPTPSVAVLLRHHGHPGFASSGTAPILLLYADFGNSMVVAYSTIAAWLLALAPSSALCGLAWPLITRTKNGT
ncbi:hypothetical protein ACQKWADRAFT_303481 [Trichoderma austrokoningii]